jgi:hypothetical protein
MQSSCLRSMLKFYLEKQVQDWTSRSHLYLCTLGLVLSSAQKKVSREDKILCSWLRHFRARTTVKHTLNLSTSWKVNSTHVAAKYQIQRPFQFVFLNITICLIILSYYCYRRLKRVLLRHLMMSTEPLNYQKVISVFKRLI